MRPRLASITVLLLAMLHGVVITAAETAWTDVTVRVYNMTDLGSPALREALATAAAALGGANVEVIWRDCTNGNSATDACDAPMTRSELAIRIVRSPAPARDRGDASLGDALVDVSTGQGVLGTLYIDRVQWLADSAGAKASTLLGRAIAHELGHLLLLTRDHSKYGLMRAVWSRQEVQRGTGRDWAFTKVDIAAIQKRAFRLKPEVTGRM